MTSRRSFKWVLAATAVAVLGACGGGGGSPSANTAATINGITVPPAPDPVANSSTLGGVDSNNNGVRDDVEREMAKNNPASFSELLQYAKVFQSDITGSGAFTTTEMDKAFCTSINENYNAGKIETLFLNTNDRLAAFYKNRKSIAIPDCST